MTDDELNAAVARLMYPDAKFDELPVKFAINQSGDVTTDFKPGYWVQIPKGAEYKLLPRYTEDLNAIVEVCKKLDYGISIEDTDEHCYVALHHYGVTYRDIKDSTLHAIARALCEALVAAAGVQDGS